MARDEPAPAAERQPPERDWVDCVLADWARAWPELDTAPAAIVGRVGRLRAFFDAGLERTFRQFGLSRADFDVLATLRRSGAPYRLPQHAVMRALLRTSGTISFRIDRLERAGLVRRDPDPDDGRGVLVALTAQGKQLVEAVAPVHLANEERMLAALTPAERATLAHLLRTLLLSFEAPPDPRMTWKGCNPSMMTPAPRQPDIAAISQRRRAEWTERVERFARDAAPKTRPFAEALVALLPPPLGGRVLDVATGTGLVAVEAARRIGPPGSVLATDFIPEWEPHVAVAVTAAGVTNVRFEEMAADALAVPDASFDVVYCQFGLMFVPEPLAALREMRRVLRPKGRLGIAVWSVPEKVGLFLVPRIIGPALPPPPGEPPPSPMSMGAPGLAEGLVAEAGFRDVAAHEVTLFQEVPDPEAEWQRWSEDLSTPDGGGFAALPERERQRLHDEAMAAFEAFRVGDTVRVPSEAILVTAVR